MIKIVNSKESAAECCNEILSAFKKHHFVRVKIKQETRTDRQNNWQFQAYTMLEAQGDLTRFEYRNYCKYHFGLAIRAADDRLFSALMRPMLLKLAYEDRINAMAFIDVTSTFDVEQMALYINEIAIHFQDKQLPEKQGI